MDDPLLARNTWTPSSDEESRAAANRQNASIVKAAVLNWGDRNAYRCGRCGQIKKGHVCTFKVAEGEGADGANGRAGRDEDWEERR